MCRLPFRPTILVESPHREPDIHGSDTYLLQAAASAFNILFKSGGGSAVESVIPTLLSGLEGDDEQAAQAVEGLRVILGVRPQTLGSMVGACTFLRLWCNSQAKLHALS